MSFHQAGRGAGANGGDARPVMTVVTLTVLVVLTTIAGGCESVDHIRAFNEARDIYNDTTTSANDTAFASILPVEGYAQAATGWNHTDTKLSTGFSGDDYIRYHERYATAAAMLRALHGNTTTKQALVRDKLYATSATLELLSAWKAGFYARLLKVDPPQPSEPGTGETEPSNSSSSVLLDVRSRRDALVSELKTLDLVVFPRDQFLLDAMDALLTYDNAYLFAVEWDRGGRFDPKQIPDRSERLENVRKIVKAMALAEKQLAARFEPRAGEGYLVMASVAARFTMLRTAVQIVTQSKVKHLTDGEHPAGAVWSYAEAASDGRGGIAEVGLPTLTSRMKAFHDEAMNAKSTVNRFFASLDVQTMQIDQLLGTYWEGPYPDGSESGGDGAQ